MKHSIVALILACVTTALAADPFERTTIIRLLRQANDWQTAHPRMKADDRNWERGTWFTGIMAAYQATGDERYLNQALAWGQQHQWQVGTEQCGANKLFCAMTWLELFQLRHDPAMIQPTIAWLATDAPNSPGGAKVWFGHAPAPFDAPLYSDSLFAMPALAMFHQATGERNYLDLLHHFARTVTAELLDKDANLFYRDGSFIGKQSPAGAKILWSRGNGWVFAGLPRVIECLAANDPDLEFYIGLFKKMAASIAKCQGVDGLWRPNLADPQHIPEKETSGTGFFCNGLAWGIRTGLLDRPTYLPVARNAWAALAASVTPDGMIQWGQQVGDRPSAVQPNQTHEYVTGAFLLAGSEMLRLLDAEMLPAAAIGTGPLLGAAHPLADRINAFLTNQAAGGDFSATGLNRNDYLRVIEGQVRAMRPYQNVAGRIIDPVEKAEKYFSTPCFAHAVAVLAASGHPQDADLIECGMKALDAATADMATATAAGNHGDFFTWPVMFAYQLFQRHASAERRAIWERNLRAVEPKKLYRASQGKGNNWGVVNLAGEFLRQRVGFASLDYVESSLAVQVPNLTDLGMYNEAGNPTPYDHFSRYYLAGMLQQGYPGAYRTQLGDSLWRAAWVSLFMQSPDGEMPTGFRSSQHIWNEAEQCVTFEIYAKAYGKAGRAAEAGAFKRAAHLSLQSVLSWLRPDGSGYIVKNRYPIEAKHGYETYSAHTCYNLLACSMLAQAWQFADDAVVEQPAPADIGGFVVPIIEPFHKIFANAGGTYVEYDTCGDHKYNPTGLLRIHVKGGHPQLGPSDACATLFSGPGVNVATGPAWQEADGTWRSLAELSPPAPKVEILEQQPACVRFRVTYDRITTQTILVEPTGVTITDELSAPGDRMQITWPMLIDDGAGQTQVEMAGNSISLRLRGRGIRFTMIEPAGVTLTRAGKSLGHRNGIVEIATAEFAGRRAVYRIDSPKQP